MFQTNQFSTYFILHVLLLGFFFRSYIYYINPSRQKFQKHVY